MTRIHKEGEGKLGSDVYVQRIELGRDFAYSDERKRAIKRALFFFFLGKWNEM